MAMSVTRKVNLVTIKATVYDPATKTVSEKTVQAYSFRKITQESVAKLFHVGNVIDFEVTGCEQRKLHMKTANFIACSDEYKHEGII